MCITIQNCDCENNSKLLQTWKYEDMKVLSTTTMMSLFFCLMTFTASAMSTILKVGLVGVSNQTSCQFKT